jgi:hypothetical protein
VFTSVARPNRKETRADAPMHILAPRIEDATADIGKTACPLPLALTCTHYAMNDILAEGSVTTTRGQIVFSTKALVQIIKRGMSVASFSINTPDGAHYRRPQPLNEEPAAFGPDGKHVVRIERRHD